MAQAGLKRPPAISPVPSDTGNARQTNVRFADAINQALRGTLAATMGVTLAANATTSTFSDSRIGPYTSVGLTPMSAHAVDVLPSVWTEPTQGAVTIHHANTPYTDLQFVACLIG
jgi:hypothetical protein